MLLIDTVVSPCRLRILLLNLCRFLFFNHCLLLSDEHLPLFLMEF